MRLAPILCTDQAINSNRIFNGKGKFEQEIHAYLIRLTEKMDQPRPAFKRMSHYFQ
jgi:hypothetical protein